MPVRHFNTDNQQPPKKGGGARDAYEQKQREKEQKAPEVDEKEETSFQDTHLTIKVIIFSTIVFGSMYLVHRKMSELVEKRKRRLMGMDEQLTEKDKINAIGGQWLLKDLNGDNFGSYNLQGNYYILYFGFSLCPDICPLSLMKLNKSVRKAQQSNEGKQYFQLKCVFVTVNPEYDTPERLKEYCNLYDKNLIGLREVSNSSENLLNMLRIFKVPVGLNDEERKAINDYFTQRKTKESRFSKLKFWNRLGSSNFDPLDGMMNDHSKVFYLMAPDNRFLAFYPLDLEENELATSIIEDISYDLGTTYIGTGKKPPVNISAL